MDDRDVRPRDLVHGDVARLVPLIWRVRQEEQVPAVERRFHRATVHVSPPQADMTSATSTCPGPPRCELEDCDVCADAPEHNNDRRLRVGDEPQALPDHEPGREHRHEVEDLQQHLVVAGNHSVRDFSSPRKFALHTND